MNDISFNEILEKALELGWDDASATPAQVPEADKAFLLQWLAEKKQGDLSYLENPVRLDPQEFFPGAKTALIFVSHYKQEKVSFSDEKGVVASYARGLDYHNVHKRRLKKFIRWLEEKSGEEGIARGFSDAHPVLERALAAQSGIGWMGKNTLLIHRKFGTFFLLSGLFTSLDLPTQPLVDTRFPRCGSCTKCLDACPTQALTPYAIDATKCLAYHTIESKKEIPPKIQEENPGYIFGCDICQEVCPHNVRPPLSSSPDFHPDRGVGPYVGTDELQLMELEPEALFATPLKRRGKEGLNYTLSTLHPPDPTSSSQ